MLSLAAQVAPDWSVGFITWSARCVHFPCQVKRQTNFSPLEFCFRTTANRLLRERRAYLSGTVSIVTCLPGGQLPVVSSEKVRARFKSPPCSPQYDPCQTEMWHHAATSSAGIHSTSFSFCVCAGAECGTVVLLQPKGAVWSPAYPQAYSNNTLCRWVIYAPEGHIVKVKTTLKLLCWPSQCLVTPLSSRDLSVRSWMHACSEIGSSDRFHCKRECDTQLDSKGRRYDVTAAM